MRTLPVRSTHPKPEGLPVPAEGLAAGHLSGLGWGHRRHLLVLGMEELDEALQEVGPLLHLALPSFEQVLVGERGKTHRELKPDPGPGAGVPTPN